MPSYSRVYQPAFKVIISVFFAVAMAAAASRCAIRLWYLKRLRVDDYLLLVSCVFLTAATGVLLYGTPSIFFAAEVAFDNLASFQGSLDEAEILSKQNEFITIGWSYLALSWTAIFMIKFGFLALFRQLVDLVAQIYAFWKGVVIFTILVMAFAICDAFIACSKTGLATGLSIALQSVLNVDNPWGFMWQQMEACVAVSMLSLTSFRVFFVGPNSSPGKANHWIPSTRRVLARRKKTTCADQYLDDKPIPSAPLTGLSGFFDGLKPSKSTDESTISDAWPLSDRQQDPSGHV
ncbi:hypothetical protein Q9189_005324 [Teloschistes chrysophthalmus]